jgi:hypothetical protein
VWVTNLLNMSFSDLTVGLDIMGPRPSPVSVVIGCGTLRRFSLARMLLAVKPFSQSQEEKAFEALT